MLIFKTAQRIGLWSVVIVLAGVLPFPSLANITTIQISSGSRQSKLLKGFTRGTVGLHNIVGERDQRQKRCMGYGSASPDHQLEIKRGVPQVSFQVRTKLKDTTLIVQGPRNSVFCADDSSLGKDAGMTLNNLPPGFYRVWVGAFNAGDKFSYTLSIR